MNNELKQLIERVKSSKEPVQQVVEGFFNEVTWSLLKDEFAKMTKLQKKAFFKHMEAKRAD